MSEPKDSSAADGGRGSPPAPPTPDPIAGSPFNPRDLGAVCFAALGVWMVCGGLLILIQQLQAWDGDVLGAWAWELAPMLATGAVLFLGARALARITMPRGPVAAPPQITPLLAAAVALLGVLLVIDQLDSVIRVAAPFVVYRQDEEIPWQWPVADVLVVALGGLLFARAGAIARLWERCNTR